MSLILEPPTYLHDPDLRFPLPAVLSQKVGDYARLLATMFYATEVGNAELDLAEANTMAYEFHYQLRQFQYEMLKEHDPVHKSLVDFAIPKLAFPMQSSEQFSKAKPGHRKLRLTSRLDRRYGFAYWDYELSNATFDLLEEGLVACIFAEMIWRHETGRIGDYKMHFPKKSKMEAIRYYLLTRQSKSAVQEVVTLTGSAKQKTKKPSPNHISGRMAHNLHVLPYWAAAAHLLDFDISQPHLCRQKLATKSPKEFFSLVGLYKGFLTYLREKQESSTEPTPRQWELVRFPKWAKPESDFLFKEISVIEKLAKKCENVA